MHRSCEPERTAGRRPAPAVISAGTIFPIEVSLRILDIDGVRFHQAIIRDISERKKAEEQILDALREAASFSTSSSSTR